MISLAGRDILHAWGKFLFTGLGLGLLIGVTLSMAGVYRGMVEDGRALIQASGADLWVVQQDTLGPFAEPSGLRDDLWRNIAALEGVAAAANVTYMTLQIHSDRHESRVMLVGLTPGDNRLPGWPRFLLAGRHISRGHYEAVADIASGFHLGETLKIKRHHYTVVGLTRRMVSPSGDPMVFIPLKDAQEAQFQKDNDSIIRQRHRTAANPVLSDSRVQTAVNALLNNQQQVNAVLVRLQPGAQRTRIAEHIRRWQRLQVYDNQQMERILVGKLIATAARQIGLFLVILSLVSATIVAFIIYTLTMDKIREIAVLKLIGTRNRTIAGMILQQALALGIIGFVIGKIAATFAAPHFPKYVVLLPRDSITGLLAVLCICALASLVAIRMALKVDPAEALGG